MSIFSAHQIKAIDEATIKELSISSWDLMERASNLAVNQLLNYCNTNSKLLFWCGKGNNGGDGLAMARICKEKGYSVDVIYQSGETSPDNSKNFQLLKGAGVSHCKWGDFDFTQLNIEKTIFVDAILGNGIKGAVKGAAANMINKFNGYDVAYKIAIDIPSGVIPDKAAQHELTTKVNQTLVFEFPKWCLLFPESQKYTDVFKVVPIGLSSIAIQSQIPIANFITEISIPKRKKFSHKGNFGKCAIAGGGKGMWGAVLLSLKAALKCGPGWTTALIPKAMQDVITSFAPEILTDFIGIEEPEYFLKENSFDVIGIGPGLSKSENAFNCLKQVIKNHKGKFVIDADAINLISDHPSLLSQFSPNSAVFTPHIGEFKRLVGGFKDSDEMVVKAIQWCKFNQQFLVIKGAHTLIVFPSGKIYFNSSGCPALAKAGSGDVLTGMIVGLITRLNSISEGIKSAVYLHGKSSEIASISISEDSVCASDIIKHISSALLYSSLHKD